jgi:branched-chain amino acid transport system permease protein
MDAFTVDIDGTAIYYVAEGSGAPVLYVHGNLASSLWWERVMAVPGRRTIALDLPNFGRSGRLADTSPLSPSGTKSGINLIDLYADYAAKFIQALGLSDLALVGHSLGGAVAISLVTRYPELVSRLVLLDSTSFGGIFTPEERMPLIDMMIGNRAIIGQGLAGVAPTLADKEFLGRLTDDAMLLNPDAFKGNARGLSTFSARAGEGKYAKPVLVLVGKLDYLIPLAEAENTKRGFPKSELTVFETVGHSAMAEDPGLFLGALTTFLSKE